VFINSPLEKCNLSLLPEGGNVIFCVPIPLVPFRVGGRGINQNGPMSPSEQFFLKASLRNPFCTFALLFRKGTRSCKIFLIFMIVLINICLDCAPLNLFWTLSFSASPLPDQLSACWQSWRPFLAFLDFLTP